MNITALADLTLNAKFDAYEIALKNFNPTFWAQVTSGVDRWCCRFKTHIVSTLIAAFCINGFDPAVKNPLASKSRQKTLTSMPLNLKPSAKPKPYGMAGIQNMLMPEQNKEDDKPLDSQSKAQSDFELPRIAITKVIEIEEEIWSPKFGLRLPTDKLTNSLGNNKESITDPSSSKDNVKKANKDLKPSKQNIQLLKQLNSGDMCKAKYGRDRKYYIAKIITSVPNNCNSNNTRMHTVGFEGYDATELVSALEIRPVTEHKKQSSETVELESDKVWKRKKNEKKTIKKLLMMQSSYKTEILATTVKGFKSDSFNEDQWGVIEKAMCTEEYALILGMPGTGKTTTIAELIKTLIGAGNTPESAEEFERRLMESWMAAATRRCDSEDAVQNQ
ncbi:hypothetical protein BY996DRAFT_6531905 [Phakopsora pachyrhizi]|nr:hypothetical protein BY996DRAFT_6531905 [Phakopsora pachyrhizi]